jgi:hypothetical protein
MEQGGERMSEDFQNGNGGNMDKIREVVMAAAQKAGVPVVEHFDGAGHIAESVHEPPLIFTDECLAGMIVAFDGGDMTTFRRLYDEALNERFEAGLQYAVDTVGEWHRP